ncbi:MAG: hypothetical protein FWC66_10080, partial [Oscillospiraceae bacterium]|nr:hypothetical protein [Oscillospiraceae bacterium]
GKCGQSTLGEIRTHIRAESDEPISPECTEQRRPPPVKSSRRTPERPDADTYGLRLDKALAAVVFAASL